MKVALLSVLVACALALPENYKTYEGYKVFSVSPKSDAQARLLRQWMLSNVALDFWQEAKFGEPAHIMVEPKQIGPFTAQLRKHDLDWSIYVDNVGEQVAELRAHEAERRMKDSKAFDINDFNTYEDIIAWMNSDVISMCDQSGLTCSTQIEGQSFEGRDIVSLTMSSGSGKQTFLLNSLIHAREWLTGATVSKMIENIAVNYGSDDAMTELMTKYDFVIIPVLNPDGYTYSWDSERLWRKNRAVFDGTNCRGVDLNRNYDYNWGEEGVSDLPCADTYCGPSANSELETQTMDQIMARLAPNVIGYMDMHAYGYMWMHPWGNTVNFNGVTCERADDHDDMYQVADAAADAVEATHNTRWARGTSCEVIYATTGATDDYIKGVHGVKYPVCPEVRGNSFIIDPSEIQPSFEEVWNGIVTMIAEIEIIESPAI